MRKKKLVFSVLATLAVVVAAFLGRVGTASAVEPERATLAVYTYRTPGICPGCDAARPIMTRLSAFYPIEFVYVEDPESRTRLAADGVDRFPTFVLTLRDSGEASREVLRWSGAADLERRVRTAFRIVGVVPGTGRPAPDRRPTR